MSEEKKKSKIKGHKIKNNELMVGDSPSMRELFSYLPHLANKPTTVLITGETGTGKGLFAEALHYNSRTRATYKFLTVNCVGIPSDLLETELFGHVKGAFTGAISDKQGKFQYANKGTLFFDEIGDMSFDLQAKILTALQTKEITPVGALKHEKIEVRIVAATNKNLEKEVEKGNFREDLFYRLNVFPIHVPPLRKRKGDIPFLLSYFINKLNKEYGSKVEGLTDEALEGFLAYRWPGNIRELENVIENAFVLKDRGYLELDNFNSHTKNINGKNIISRSLDVYDEELGLSLTAAYVVKNRIPINTLFSSLEEKLYRESIKAEEGEPNVSKLAKNLGVGRATFYRKAKKYGFEIKRD